MRLRIFHSVPFGAVVVFAASAVAQSPVGAPAPMQQLLARGVGAAPVESGLSFALTITNGGRNILAGPWALRAPGTDGVLRLSFERLRLESGSLEAVARIKNETRVFAGGLRLDFLEITEGTPVPGQGSTAQVSLQGKSRPLLLASPLFFGDLEPRADAAIPFRLEPIGLAPDSPYAVIRGVVTRVVAGASAEISESSDPVAIDSDGEGRLYVGDGAAQAIFRLVPDARTVRKFDAGCPITGIAVRKKSGEVYASCRDVPALVRLSANGRVGRTESIGRALGPIRYGGKGFLYGAPSSIVRLEGLSVAEEISAFVGSPLRAAGFDVGLDGTIFAVTAEPEGRLLRIRSALDVVAIAGPGNGLGAISSPRTCRIGPEGSIYVLEAPAGDRPPRVTVFDPAGRLVRAWSLAPGEPVDLAFGGPGRLDVVWKREKAGSRVTEFQIF